VVHLGAGPYFISELYEHLSAEKFVLVDADPQAFETLRDSVPCDRYAVHAYFLRRESGKKPFYRYNLPNLNGPLLPGTLSGIYPRLRETETLELIATTPNEFLSEITTTDQSTNCLILDLPGQESELLAAMDEEILHRFEWIFVKGAGQLRMENAKPIDETTKVLAQAGFSPCNLENSEGELYPLAAYHLDKNAVHLLRLQEACAKLKAQFAETEKKRADLAGQLDARTKERDSLASEKNAANAQLSTLTTERDQLKKTAGDHHSALTSAKQEIETLKAQFAETEKKRADLAGQLDARTKERDSLASEKNAANAQLSTLTTERDKLKARITELETRLGKREVAKEEILNAERQLEVLKDLIRVPLR
jgi:hypothetical protein